MSSSVKTRTALHAPSQTEFLAPSLRLWRFVLLGLIVVALVDTFLSRTRPLTELYFYQQDFPLVVGSLVLLSGLFFVRPLRWTIGLPTPDWRVPAAIALITIAFSWIASKLVYDDYALSLDEFLARFDARVFQQGYWVGQIPPALRAYAPALQSQFVLYSPDHAAWISGYEPMNAALQALGALLGAQSLVGPLLAGLAIVATWGVARHLWPDKPSAAVTAAVLLATSSQFLVTAMTPYAMTAHLALNMTWLWLFLRGGRLGHGLAPIAAFIATGLHQIVFHPLFAAPFVLELWLERRWRAATWHTFTYALIGGFWLLLYPSQLAHHMATGNQAVAAVAHQTSVMRRAADLLTNFNISGLGLMAKNLVRFFTWQSLLTLPLALIAMPAAIRSRGTLRAVVVGVFLSAAAMLVLLPYQGHGWGYRYLHGLLGTLSLLAAWSWTRLTHSTEPARERGASTVFATAAATSLLILMPIRLFQVHAFVHPYVVAERAINATPVDLVLVDSQAMWFGADLVRNDPFLRNRPLIMDMNSLRPQQVQALCAQYRLGSFGRIRAISAGMRLNKGVPDATILPIAIGCTK